MARLMPRRSRSAMNLYRPLEAPARHAALQAAAPRRAADAVGQPADARAHGPGGARRAPAPASRRRARAPIWIHDFGLQSALADADVEVDATASRVRGGVRRGAGAARSRTTTSTAWCSRRACRRTRSWCCAPMRSTCGRSASRCRRPSSRARWWPMPAIARALVALFKLRFDPAQGPMRGCAAARRCAQIEAALEQVANLVGRPRAAPATWR